MKNLIKTKIVATLGPSSNTKEMIRKLVETGVTMFRLNSSHGDFEQHLQNLTYIREVEKEFDTLIPVLLDLQGPKIRVGLLNEPIEIKKDDIIKFRHQEKMTDDGVLPVDYEGIAKDVSAGAKILLDDGKLSLEVVKIEGDTVVTKVLAGGLLKQRKGINIPGSTGSIQVLTERDKEFVKFASEHEVDYLGLSFVREGKDITELKELIEKYKGRCRIISKVEKPQAIKNIDEIIEKSAGIMVARGDLGIEISPEKVPTAQKEIIKKANAQRKVVIVATQMLESMIDNPIPTRAEASDVANAIIDGTDAIMLSGETAAGKYPIEAVKMMVSIAEEVENSNLIKQNHYDDETLEINKNASIAICSAVVDMIDKIKVKGILTFTASGYTAKLLSKAKPTVPIFAFCKGHRSCRRLKLYRDVYPIHMCTDIAGDMSDEAIKAFNKVLMENYGLKKGDTIIFTGALPELMSGKTNFIKIHEVGSLS